MRTPVPAMLLAVLTSWATAQRVGSTPAHFAPTRQPTAPPTSLRSLPAREGFASFRHFHSSPFQSLFYPFGIFPDSSYADSPSPASGPSPAQSDLLLQALSAALTANQQQPDKPDSQSLLIELQGDRYVTLTAAKTPSNAPDPDAARAPSSAIPRSRILPPSPKDESREKPTAAHELLPITLLFRDGHREEVRDYTIADGTIYARGDLYTDGYWNKKIELSALDLRETVKFNEAHGVHFTLPSSPNEVMTRP